MKRGNKGKYRLLTTILSVALVACVVAGGTVAWLIADTDPVINTFTYGDIDLELDETKTDEDGNPVDEDGNIVGEDEEPAKTTDGNRYDMVPGEEYLKDPEVRVLEGNENCWLFVELNKEGGVVIENPDGTTTEYTFDDYLTFIIADGWTQLYEDGHFGDDTYKVEGVYYRFVAEDVDDKEDTVTAFDVLAENKITVNGTVTKEMLNLLDDNGKDEANATYPKLSITAYAIQYSGFEPVVVDGATDAEKLENQNTAVLKAWTEVGKMNADTTTP